VRVGPAPLQQRLYGFAQIAAIGVAALIVAGCSERTTSPRNGPIVAYAPGGVAVISPDGRERRLLRAKVGEWLQWVRAHSGIGNELGTVRRRPFGVVEILDAGGGRRLVLTALFASWAHGRPQGRIRSRYMPVGHLHSSGREPG
jgi:hypothetical protein